MRVQKSYSDKIATLYLVPTPIGNFEDMTYRSVKTLEEVDIIYAEDTRVSKVLLSHFKITTHLSSYHIFNEDTTSLEIIQKLKNGSNIALITDAGMPGISDPGYLVAKKAIDAGFNVISLPGASAPITALVASGLATNHFLFYGFLDHKKSQKEKELLSLVDNKETMIFYESPLRLNETLELIFKVLGNREICIARELTKKYEEYTRGKLEDIINSNLKFLGEIVVIVEGAKENTELTSKTIAEHYQYYIDLGYDQKEAMKNVAKDRKISKSEIYKVIKK